MISRDTSSLDYGRLVLASRRLGAAPNHQRKRLALVGDAATQLFVPLFRTLFHENGVTVEIYEGHFDAVDLEVLNPNSELYRFEPDTILLLNCTQSLRSKYYGRAGSGEDFGAASLSRITNAWEAIHRSCPAVAVQCNFVMPYERTFGNFDHSVAGSFHAVVQHLNQLLAEEVRKRNYVFISDVAAIAATVGSRNWFDERHWIGSKAFCSPEYLPLVAQNFVEIALATMGRVVKCIVLDLDNTLWGGVIGDDGPEGIQINAHGEGETFYNFQCYLRELKRRGIILAVCSKNDYDTAIRPFRENPEMVLKEEDIAAFVANWNNKADNIRVIRDTLNIAFDSMVFLDDNPFERNLVRELVPEVIVPELPEDPADFARALADLNLFETNSFSAEDLVRADQYRQEAQRRVTTAQYTSIEDYLKSLEMKIQVARFDEFHLPRIAQLIQRSNQFNLTTRRLNLAQCEAMMADYQGCIPLYARLSDRFGDHGLISVVVAAPKGEELLISDWLMSCRVLTRGVEEYLMNRIFEEAQARGCRRVVGEYIPTVKNSMVREFYARFGFHKIGDGENGRAVWALEVAEYTRFEAFINPVEAARAARAG
jgi:FkbH-like protein